MKKKCLLLLVLLMSVNVCAGCSSDNTTSDSEITSEIEDETLTGTWISNDEDLIIHFAENNMLYVFTGVNNGIIVDNILYVDGNKQPNVEILENITQDEDVDIFNMYKISVEYENYEKETRDMLEYNSKVYEGSSGTEFIGVYVDYEADKDKLTYTAHNMLEENAVGYSYKIEGNTLKLTASEDGYEINMTKDHNLDGIDKYLDYITLDESEILGALN